MYQNSELEEIFSSFAISGKLLSYEELSRGHIHKTFISTFINNGETRKFLHQQINNSVFSNTSVLMRNIQGVISHLKCFTTATTLNLINTKDGDPFYTDQKGKPWRTYTFIDGTVTFDICPNSKVAYQSGKVLGEFLTALVDLKPNTLEEAIPDFQNIEKRFESLKRILTTSDRAANAKPEIDFILAREILFHTIEKARAEKLIPTRVTHGDPKINNILFDSKNETGLLIIDLDTVMPGTWAYDFGDLARNVALRCAEDEKEITKVKWDIKFFREMARGFLTSTSKHLVKGEREVLTAAPLILALNLAARFLTDYLDHDKYFKISYAEHNLVRARVQIEVVKQMESLAGEIEKELL